MGKPSKLIQDLSNVPSIVGGLGLSVAEAQKVFNLDYLDNIERLLVLSSSLLNPKKADGSAVGNKETQEFVMSLLQQLAPSRYQFTETTLSVKLDLAQTMDVGASASFGVGMGAVSVNAGMTVGFGYDYRAAAEVKTVIHAIPSNDAAFQKLLGRAKELGDAELELPAAAQVDKDLVEKAHQLVAKAAGEKELKQPEEEAPEEG